MSKGGKEQSSKGHSLPREPNSKRFRFIEEHGSDFPTTHPCLVLDVSEKALRAYPSRPTAAKRHDRSDAHQETILASALAVTADREL